MRIGSIAKPTLGRLPIYVSYLESIVNEKTNISATSIAKALGLGEVQVRKDLNAACGGGKPKIGYNSKTLLLQLKAYLGQSTCHEAVIVGAGKLGRALLDYDGVRDYGINISAAFDIALEAAQKSEQGRALLPMGQFEEYCRKNNIKIGIITVPKEAAQEVCDCMVENNIAAIWSFAPIPLQVPASVKLKEENLALSLAYLNKQV